jgi:hypothetical protein
MHSDVETLERIELIRDLRLGVYDVLIGINLLREGLDIPECGLVAILDADKEGFLRSETSLIQTIGRAARNVDGRVILYADRITGSMERAMSETSRRREKQMAYNAEHGITPQTIRRQIGDIIAHVASGDQVTVPIDEDRPHMVGHNLRAYIEELEKKMRKAAADLEFEEAGRLRDEIRQLENEELGLPVHEQKAPIMGRSTRASRGRARRGSARARSSRAGARRTDRRGNRPMKLPMGGASRYKPAPPASGGMGEGPRGKGPRSKLFVTPTRILQKPQAALGPINIPRCLSSPRPSQSGEGCANLVFARAKAWSELGEEWALAKQAREPLDSLTHLPKVDLLPLPLPNPSPCRERGYQVTRGKASGRIDGHYSGIRTRRTPAGSPQTAPPPPHPRSRFSVVTP